MGMSILSACHIIIFCEHITCLVSQVHRWRGILPQNESPTPDLVSAKKLILGISSFLQWASGKAVQALPCRNALSLLYLTTKKHVIFSREKTLSLSRKAVAIQTTGKRQS